MLNLKQAVVAVRRTEPLRHVLVLRLLAGLPLLGIGVQHLVGTAPLLPILQEAGIPFPELNAAIAPGMEVLAGLLLLSGLFGRVGGLIGANSMVVALYTHAVADWADEPPLLLPVAVLAGALYVVARGSGRYSFDAAASQTGSEDAKAMPATAATS